MQIRLLLPLVLALLTGLSGSGCRDRSPTPPPEAPGKRPAEWGWWQRTFPHFAADPDAYRTALAQAHALRAAAKHDVFGTWEPAGPVNIGGRIVDLAFDPSDPGTIYAAAATGGLFKSTDAGRTWHPLFDDQAVLNMGDVAVDPHRPQTIYVGTGEANGGHNNFAGGGVYKSTDGGRTWSFAGLEATTSIGRIVVHPEQTGRVYVAAVGSYFAPNPERGVYRSDDGGRTWDHVLSISDSTGVVDLVVRPDRPDTLFAAAWHRVRRPLEARLHGEESGIYRSVDGGDSWHKLGPEHGLPDPEAHRQADGTVAFGRIGLALCTGRPDVMYALYTDGTRYLGLYRTDDGGDHWYDADPDRRAAAATGDFSWYFGQVRVHPDDPDRVFVLDVLLAASPDGGRSWSVQMGTHVDHHALAFHPENPDVLVNGNDGGIAFSYDGGGSWQPVHGLPVTQFYEIGLDPSTPERLYGGTQDNGTVRTQTGRSDDWERIYFGDGFYTLVDPTNPDVIYAESQWGGLARSTDGGTTFLDATAGIDRADKRNWSTPVVMDPHDPNVLYYGTYRLYRSEDGARSWEAVSGNLARHAPHVPRFGTITTVAVAPTDRRVIYAGTDDGKLWVSDDYGAAWRDVTGDLPYRWITRVAVDPTDPHTAYVAFSGLKWRDPQPHVFRTADMGASWQNVSANLPDAPVNALAIDPLYPDVLFAGTDVGAFVSLDAGGHWEALGSGLPAVSVYDLKVHPTARFLVAGTHGRSMYRLDLAPLTTAVTPEPAIPEEPALVSAFPNPFATSVTLHVHLPAPGPLRVDVYDLLGRRIRSVAQGSVAAGRHVLAWDGTDDAGRFAPSGRYLVHVEGSPGRDVRPLVVTLAR